MHTHRIRAIFLDCGDTLIDEASEVKNAGDVSLRADLIPGAGALLTELKRRGYPLALVADGPVATFENNLGPYGLYDLFDAYAISEQVGVGKPAAAIFRSALDPLQIAPHDHARVLMVGNHLGRDIKGANALGLSSVWLDWAPRRAKTPADRTEQPDFTIKTPLDLLDLIDRIERGALLPKETPVPVSFAPTSPDALTLANVAHALHRQVQRMAPLQINDPASPAQGALYSPEWGMADPKLTGHYVFACGHLLLAAEQLGNSAAFAERATILDSAVAAARYLCTAQNANGLIDLLSVNYDSAPDTAFTVQDLCTVVELGRNHFAGDARWAALLEALERFIRASAPGMMTGGFHTPNHRWVIVSALVQAKRLFPDLEVADAVDAYLAEGYDIDEEGAFIERSVGVYDAVNDRSLLMIAANHPSPPAIDAVARNLDFNLHLLHADGSAETGLSRRQDYGTRRVAAHLIPCYLLCDHAQPRPVFVCAAQWLWQQMTQDALGAEATNAAWIVYALLVAGESAPAATAALPADFARFYPHNGLWRLRRDLLSASLFQHTTRLLSFTYGAAELSSLKISQTYFGQYIGRFVSNQMRVDEEIVVLHSAGRSNPRRPAYELPLGRRVPHDQWEAALPERSLRRLPHAVGELRAQEAHDARGAGLDLHYVTLEGAAGVAVQIAFDFPPGGIWQTESVRTRPAAGQVIFLKSGYGTMRYGNDVIEIGPGALAHGMWAMRDAEAAPDHVRVLLTFLTPVDVRFSVRAFRGLTSSPGAPAPA